jgi:hypothetical protein
MGRRTPHQNRPKGNDRLTLQIALATVTDIDAGVLGWLAAAYEADAELLG